MAKLHISEYSTIGAFSSPAQMALEPSIATQVIDFSGGETQSTEFSQKTKFVRVWSDADCCLAFGADPTATTSSLPIAAKVPECFGVAPGDKMSVIALA
jgi:hypothetical protein